MNAWIRSKVDIDPNCKLREAFLFRLKHILLWEDIGSAEIMPFWVRLEPSRPANHGMLLFVLQTHVLVERHSRMHLAYSCSSEVQ